MSSSQQKKDKDFKKNNTLPRILQTESKIAQLIDLWPQSKSFFKRLPINGSYYVIKVSLGSIMKAYKHLYLYTVIVVLISLSRL